MPFKVQVGPPQISIHHGQTILVSEKDGQIQWPTERGLYFRDTRVLSSWEIFANGESWEPLNGGAIVYDTARIFLTNRAIETEQGPIPPRTLGLTIGRSIDGGMHEDLDVTNNGRNPVEFQLEIALRCDFADIFEVKSHHIVRRGRISTEWSAAHRRLSTAYENRDFSRALIVTVLHRKGVYANGRLSFEVVLDPGAAWHCCLLYALRDGERHIAAPRECIGHRHRRQHSDALEGWFDKVLKVETSNEGFRLLYHQALEDMAALRLPMEKTDHAAFLPAAGVPWFVAPFGRDSLIAALQNMPVYSGFARGALDVLGSLQATQDDAYRDAEPGKIPHEMRFGELAHFKLIPHTPYYGTADATPLYLIVLHAAWRATGDRALLEQHMKTAEGCLRWIDESGDRDGDGFQEYQTRSSAGMEDMGWKDSGKAVVNADGSPVQGPKALCELQGYVYDAWLRMAEIFDALEQPERARGLRTKAAALFDRFNSAFWDDELGFYAYALDGEKRKVRSIASNAGHLLWSGIVPVERARKVVDRLMARDMWSGWGVRTLSADHPAYNPYSYQSGSVWPHDNGIIALGFKRYGFGMEAAQIAGDIVDAGGHFLSNQMPELYTTLEKGPTEFPVQYLGANVPQAWAAGSVFALLQAILGLVPDAPRKKLRIDPLLPEWLPDLTLRDLGLGRHRFDIRFWRDGDETKFEVLRGEPDLIERCSANGQFDRLQGWNPEAR